LLIKKENIVVDFEKNILIINVPFSFGLDVLSSSLYSFTDNNYILLDKGKSFFIVNVIPKLILNEGGLNKLSSHLLSQINVYYIHKQKLKENKDLVDFITGLIIKTNKVDDVCKNEIDEDLKIKLNKND